MIRSRRQLPSSAPVTPEKPGGFFQNLIDVYFSPREAFTRIVRSPAFLLPLAGYLLLVLGFTGIWMSKIDAREFMKTQLEESGQWDKIPAEQARGHPRAGPRPDEDLRLDRPRRRHPGDAARHRRRSSCSSSASSTRARSTSSRPSRSSTWTFFAVALVTTPLLLLVLQLKGDWNVNPQEAIQANLGLLLDKSEAAKPLWALLTQHRRLLPLDGLPARGRVRGRQPEDDGVGPLGRGDPLDPHRPRQGGLGGDLLRGPSRIRARGVPRASRPRLPAGRGHAIVFVSTGRP